MNNKERAMKDYLKALNEKDGAGMEEALDTIKENCDCANTLCLTELFCPECPMGMLMVKSCRAGY